MGIVKRQATKNSIVAYLGAGIGFFSTLWIYPLAEDVYGSFRWIMSTVTLFVPFASLGVFSLTTRFYPQFKKSENDDQGFLGFLLFASVLSVFLFYLLSFLFGTTFLRYLGKLEDWNNDLLLNYKFIILGSLFFLILKRVLRGYIANRQRIVVPKTIDIFTLKIIPPVLIAGYYFGFISRKNILESPFWIYTLSVIILAIYLWQLGQRMWLPKWNTTLQSQIKSMSYFAGAGILGQMGTILAYQIDVFMVGGQMDENATGVYAMALTIVGMINYPYDSINGISAPLISQAWKDNNLAKLKELYSKASNTLIFASLFIFGILYINLEDIFRLSTKPDVLNLTLPIILFLGIAKVIDSSFSVNKTILGFSKYYYVNLIITLLLAFSTVALNNYLIPTLGILGAAIGTFTAIILSNLLSYGFVWYKFGLQPFDKRSLYLFILFAILILLLSALSLDIHFVIRIALRCIIFALTSFAIVIKFEWAPDAANMAQQLFQKAKGYFK